MSDSSVYWKTRTRTPDNGQRTTDAGQTMEKTDKRWRRRTNDGKDGQTMEKTDKRWKRRTNDGKDGQMMENTEAFSHTFELKFWSNFGWCHIYCKLIRSNVDLGYM